jgi:hypothetical protein
MTTKTKNPLCPTCKTTDGLFAYGEVPFTWSEEDQEWEAVDNDAPDDDSVVYCINCEWKGKIEDLLLEDHCTTPSEAVGS